MAMGGGARLMRFLDTEGVKPLIAKDVRAVLESPVLFEYKNIKIYGIQHSVSTKHLHRYCNEYAYLYNRRKIADAERFVTAMVHTEGRLTYKQLIQK